MLVISGKEQTVKLYRENEFQSRNRDACHFRPRAREANRYAHFCFNLAIEMLVISGEQDGECVVVGIPVSISQSRCLSFQVEYQVQQAIEGEYVSISQSRCLSFQVLGCSKRTAYQKFQSRNRDACHFRFASFRYDALNRS